MGSEGQFLGNLRRVAAQHRYILPAHNLKDVAIVHAKALHLGSSGASEAMNALVGYPACSTTATNDLKDTRLG